MTGHGEVDRWREGLRMAQPPSEETLRIERERLAELDRRPRFARWVGYLSLSGPGYLQSALTLGAGSASSALIAGAVFGYSLLWVAPLGMLLGVIVLSAIAHQTLSTGMRPLAAMKRYAGAPFAWAWAIGALLASVIWHFPQYALATSTLADICDVAGFEGVKPAWLGPIVFVWAVAVSSLYGSSPRAVRLYERALKWMIWLTVACFALVVVRTGVSDWGALVRGFAAFEIPSERNQVLGAVVALSGVAAAVGVNMVFLYPYSLLARGWGREHRRLARFDLFAGMLIPYALVTSLMVVAAANTIHLAPDADATALKPLDVSLALATLVGPTAGRIVFDLGLLGMTLSTITLHMLCCGFVGAELGGFPIGSKRYRVMTLLPAPAMLAPLWWSKVAVWIAVPTNVLCGLFLPAVYIGTVVLMRKREYLGDDRPSGLKAALWNGGIVVATVVLLASLGWFLVTQLPGYLQRFTS